MSQTKKILIILTTLFTLGLIFYTLSQNTSLMGALGGDEIPREGDTTSDAGLGDGATSGPLGGLDGGPDLTPPDGTTTETERILLAVDQEDGEFIAGLELANFSSDSGTIESISESTSNYVLTMGSSGTYDITVSIDGYLTTTVENLSTVSSSSDVQTTEIVTMPYSHLVIVVDENGTAISGASVTAGYISTSSTSSMVNCDNFMTNQYGCPVKISTVKTLTAHYTATKTAYTEASAAFTEEYTALTTDQITATAVMTAESTEAEPDLDGIFDGDDDNDDDGLLDTEEEDYGTDPNDPDTDNDGLTDYEEVVTYGTDPNDFDSDDDLLLDGEEVNDYGTNPLNSDSDGDGLKDTNEINFYLTDPNDADTDNGGVDDGTEVLTDETDPLDGSDDKVATVPDTNTIDPINPLYTLSCESLNFSPGSFELDADVDSADFNFTILIQFNATLAVWEKSLYQMLTLASVETWTDKMELDSTGSGLFEDSSTGANGRPLTIDLTAYDSSTLQLDFTYTNAEAGDVLSASLKTNSDCTDTLTVTQDTDSNSSSSSNGNNNDDDTEIDTDILLNDNYSCSDPFTDTEGWAEEIICRMYNANVVIGLDPPSNFIPEEAVTNAEVTKMIVRLILDKDEDNANNLSESFDDVSGADWYDWVVKVAEYYDIIRLRDFGPLFEPNEEANRSYVALVIVRALDESLYGFDKRYNDVDVDDYFAYAIEILSQAEVDDPTDDTDENVPVVEGYDDGSFRPYSSITREEALAMVYRAYLYSEENN